VQQKTIVRNAGDEVYGKRTVKLRACFSRTRDLAFGTLFVIEIAAAGRGRAIWQGGCIERCSRKHEAKETKVSPRTLRAAQIISLLIIGVASLHAQPGPGRRPDPLHANEGPAASQREAAADAIQRAYDGLGRSTLIAQSAPRDISDLLSRGRDAYQEALSRYQSSDFMGARETAMASADLARAVEQAATANLFPTGEGQRLPAPPALAGRPSDQGQRAREDLARVQDHTARLSEELSAHASASAVPQVRALIELSRQFEQRAQTLLAANKPEQAGAMTRAADALLAASDHFVRRAWIASGVALPTPPRPPPPPPGPKGPPAPLPPP
jgi:hypothetical protein